MYLNNIVVESDENSETLAEIPQGFSFALAAQEPASD